MENNIGTLIAQIRKEKNLTQKQLAEKLNVTDKAISRWETNRGYPEVSLLIPLAQVLDVSVNELLSGKRISREEMIDNSNEVIVETIKKSKSAINILSVVITMVFTFVQIMIYYYVPSLAQPGDEMGLVFFVILATYLNSISIGFINSKLKFLVPVFTVLLFIPTILFDYNFFSKMDSEEFILYIGVFFALSLLGLLLGMLIHFVIKKIKQLTSKK
jgi:transcriptional regulator with XRE-family HTH domain